MQESAKAAALAQTESASAEESQRRPADHVPFQIEVC
jgi:hypothetical protein